MSVVPEATETEQQQPAATGLYNNQEQQQQQQIDNNNDNTGNVENDVDEATFQEAMAMTRKMYCCIGWCCLPCSLGMSFIPYFWLTCCGGEEKIRAQIRAQENME